VSQLPRSSPKTSTTLRVYLEAFATSSLPGAGLHLEDIFKPEITFRNSEPFTTSKSSPLGFLHSKTLPVLKASALNLKLQHRSSLISADSYAAPSFTFITCNALISADSYGQCQIFLHAISIDQHRDHDRYNKSNTCRSSKYNNPSILPPRYHPCQVYTIFLLQGEDHLPKPQSITHLLH